MNRKPKLGIDLTLLIGLIFGGVGLIFTLVAAALAFNMDAVIASPNSHGDVRMLPVIFGALGVILLIIGIISLILRIRKVNAMKGLFENGMVLMAEIHAVNPNYSVRVNGRYARNIECHYTDPVSGLNYTFRSRNIFVDADYLIGQQIRVYCDRSNRNIYYVDVESLLADV